MSSTTPRNNHKRINPRNKIYIGNLPSSIDKDELSRIFGSCKYGKINNIQFKDSGLKENRKCFAFITYQNHESAQKAVSQMNLKKIDGMPIRVSFARQDYINSIASSWGNISVRNISKDINPQAIQKYFSRFGEIVKFVLLENSTTAFIRYKGQKRADKAIKVGKYKCFNGQKIIVKKANSPNILIKSGIPDDIINKESFIEWIENKLKDENEEEEGEQSIDYLSDIRKAILIYLPGEKKLKQGILMFYDDESRKQMLDKLITLGFDCESLTEDEKHAKLLDFDKEWKKESKNRLFVKNLPADYDHKDIRKLFKDLEGFENCICMDQRYRTVAYVYFDSKENQIKALKESIMINFHDDESQYPAQLNASFFIDRHEKNHETIDNEYKERIEKKLNNRILKDYGDSIQYQLFNQLSFDQRNELYQDMKLYDEWANKCEELIANGAKDSENENNEDDEIINFEGDDESIEIEDDEETEEVEEEVVDDDDDNDYDDIIEKMIMIIVIIMNCNHYHHLCFIVIIFFKDKL